MIPPLRLPKLAPRKPVPIAPKFVAKTFNLPKKALPAEEPEAEFKVSGEEPPSGMFCSAVLGKVETLL